MKIERVLETCLYVDDLDAAERFYAGTLGLEQLSRQDERHVFFRCGDQMLLLFIAASCRDEQSDVPPHGASGPGHVAFAVEPDQIPAWQRHLTEHGVEIERVVDWPQGGRSIYFRDPAGNSLELATPQIWNPK